MVKSMKKVKRIIAECLISTYEYLDMYSGYGDIMHEKLLAEKEKME